MEGTENGTERENTKGKVRSNKKITRIGKDREKENGRKQKERGR